MSVLQFCSLAFIISSCIPQLRLIAYDSAYPRRTAQTTVLFFVQRNPNDPQFQPNSNYAFIISETAVLGESVGNVTATDRDNVRWKWKKQ